MRRHELPFRQGEKFGDLDVDDILDYLMEQKVLVFSGNKYHWMNDSFPAHNISLRSASQENVVIIDQSDIADVKVIGEMDTFSAMTLLHEEAIYLHQGVQYQVEKLDWEEKKAFVREVKVDYYTDANLAVSLKVLEVDKEKEAERTLIQYGDVLFRPWPPSLKIKFETHENIGSGPIHLPEQILHTTSAWVSLKKELTDINDERLEQGLIGITHALKNIVPLFVMCDPGDVFVTPQVKSSHNEKPTIYFYDRYPGGVGLSGQIYDQMHDILLETKRTIQQCPCENGCPSCIGAEVGTKTGKRDAVNLLNEFLPATV